MKILDTALSINEVTIPNTKNKILKLIRDRKNKALLVSLN